MGALRNSDYAGPRFGIQATASGRSVCACQALEGVFEVAVNCRESVSAALSHQAAAIEDQQIIVGLYFIEQVSGPEHTHAFTAA